MWILPLNLLPIATSSWCGCTPVTVTLTTEPGGSLARGALSPSFFAPSASVAAASPSPGVAGALPLPALAPAAALRGVVEAVAAEGASPEVRRRGTWARRRPPVEVQGRTWKREKKIGLQPQKLSTLTWGRGMQVSNLRGRKTYDGSLKGHARQKD